MCFVSHAAFTLRCEITPFTVSRCEGVGHVLVAVLLAGVDEVVVAVPVGRMFKERERKKKSSALEGEPVRATQAEHTGSSHHKRVRAHHTNTHTQYMLPRGCCKLARARGRGGPRRLPRGAP